MFMFIFADRCRPLLIVHVASKCVVDTTLNKPQFCADATFFLSFSHRLFLVLVSHFLIMYFFSRSDGTFLHVCRPYLVRTRSFLRRQLLRHSVFSYCVAATQRTFRAQYRGGTGTRVNFILYNIKYMNYFFFNSLCCQCAFGQVS